MNNKVNALVLLFLASFGVGLPIHAMEKTVEVIQDGEDLLSNFFINQPKEALPGRFLHEIGSDETAHKAFKNLCSLSRTSSGFNNFLKDKDVSIDLIRYMHNKYAIPGEEMVPLLFFTHKEIAYYYYRKGCDEGRGEVRDGVTFNPFAEFEASEISVPVEELLLAIEKQKLHIIRLLAHFGASFHTTKVCVGKKGTYYHTTPLQKALKIDNSELAKLCIKLGKAATNTLCFFDILTDSEYRDLLGPKGVPELIKTFVDLGADINARQWGQTPLQLVISNAQAGYDKDEIVKALLSQGASPHSLTLYGQTPLDLAHDNLSYAWISFPLTLAKFVTRIVYGVYGSVSLLSSDEKSLQVCEKNFHTLLVLECLWPLFSILQKKLEVAALYAAEHDIIGRQFVNEDFDQTRRDFQTLLVRYLFGPEDLGQIMRNPRQNNLKDIGFKETEIKSIVKLLEEKGGVAAPYLGYQYYKDNASSI